MAVVHLLDAAKVADEEELDAVAGGGEVEHCMAEPAIEAQQARAHVIAALRLGARLPLALTQQSVAYIVPRDGLHPPLLAPVQQLLLQLRTNSLQARLIQHRRRIGNGRYRGAASTAHRP